MTRGKQDIIVCWLQHDYGRLGRPAEKIAHELAKREDVGSVLFVEPPAPVGSRGLRPRRWERPHPRPDGVPEGFVDDLKVSSEEDGVIRYRYTGATTPDPKRFADAVLADAGLVRPVLLNCGVSGWNAWFQDGFAPRASKVVLVTHDKLELWPESRKGARQALKGIRERLVRTSDIVAGLSQGSIDDVPGAVYVGHGCDGIWESPTVDEMPPWAALRDIARPRAVYYGTMSIRVDHRALQAVADSGMDVVLVGLSPSREISRLIRRSPRVHYLGVCPPEESPSILLHCDVGLVPHTDEPFTASMEPHKVYNYACARLPVVTLNCVNPPRLQAAVFEASGVDSFVGATRSAAAAGPLSESLVTTARGITWAGVAEQLREFAE